MRLLQNLADRELIERACNGHEQAFEVLFCRYGNDIRSVIVRCVKDRLVAEDLSQDTFVRIFTSLKRGKYREQGNFLPWALRIARNLCMDHLRKAAQFSRSNIVMEEDFLCTTPDQGAENHLAAKQLEQHLQIFLNRLPDDQKKVICYCFFEELSFKEIAALMNTSVSTSRGRMRYGLAHLRKQATNKPSSFWP